MIEVNFPSGVNAVKIAPINQWDYNQKLSITGIDGASAVYQVHFYNRFSREAVRRLAYAVNGAYEVDIPNRMTREKYDITAAIYANDYESAPDVTISSVGIYYTRVWVAAAGYYKYTAHELPKEYDANATYYKRIGETIKHIIIPVIPRVEPCNCLDIDDPTDEELIAELLEYCKNLNSKVDYNSQVVEEFTQKAVVKVVTTAEYNALVSAGKIEVGVLYCIDDEEIYKAQQILIDNTYYKIATTTDTEATGQAGYITFILEE